MPAGRESKLTPDRQERICDALRKGYPRRLAAIFGGISEQTFYTWLDRGKPESDGFEDKYLEFSESVAHAEAEYEAKMIDVITRDAESHPRNEGYKAAIEWLQRRRPNDWARLEKQEHVHELKPGKIVIDGEEIEF